MLVVGPKTALENFQGFCRATNAILIDERRDSHGQHTTIKTIAGDSAKASCMPFIPLVAGALGKTFLNVACKDVRVDGLAAFLQHLNGDRGILTGEQCSWPRLTASFQSTKQILTPGTEIGEIVSNHLSVVDEPFMWGILPLSTFLDERTVRYTLGASDVMFNSSFQSWFFKSGQIIETHRGKGIYQDAIDQATSKLENGRWVRTAACWTIRYHVTDAAR